VTKFRALIGMQTLWGFGWQCCWAGIDRRK